MKDEIEDINELVAKRDWEDFKKKQVLESFLQQIK